MSGIKYDQNKRMWTLLPFKALEEVVEILEFGSKKYGKDNWKQGLDNERLLNSVFRHLIAFKCGEILDVESSKSHLAHSIANLLFIISNNLQVYE